MQLIFDSESETCIDKKMALIDKETINEKFADDANIIEKLSSKISNGNGNKENIDKEDNIVVEKCKDTEDVDSAKTIVVNGQDKLNLEEKTHDADTAASHSIDNNSSETLGHTESIAKNIRLLEESNKSIVNEKEKENFEDPSSNTSNESIVKDIDLRDSPVNEIALPKENVEVNTNESIDPSEDKQEKGSMNDDTDILDSANSISIPESVENKTEVSTVSEDHEQNIVKSQDEIEENGTKNPSESMDVDESFNAQSDYDRNESLEMDVENNSKNIEITNNKELETEDIISEKEKASLNECVTTVAETEIIKISDDALERDPKECTIDEDVIEIDNKDVNPSHAEREIGEKLEPTLIEGDKNESSEGPMEVGESSSKIENETQLNNLSNAGTNTIVQKEIIDKEKSCDTAKTEPKQETPLEKRNEPKKRFTKSKLSLDILSDDEDTPPPESNKNTESNDNNKQCINIEDDDDDIMLIDDESSTKGEDKIEAEPPTNETKQEVDEKKEEVVLEVKKDESVENSSTSIKDTQDDQKTKEKIDIDPHEPEKKEEKPQPSKSLLPVNFVSACKKNLAEMTRTELEEFCILKIVESVVDRGNLGEIKSQLKKMAQNIEEYKNKTKLLTKQNHALQVVLKSVQEELKKNTNTPITPLKISRSVGIQVLMSDKNKKKTNTNVNITANVTNSSPVNKHIRGAQGPNLRSPKTPAQNNIPVPRLVPASSGKNTTPNLSPTANNKPTSNPPSAKKATRPEKRALVKVQSDTVDLTDDEPPPKVSSRPMANHAVRLVPPQTLMAHQRAPSGALINSPRKVYIPISGGQAQNVRPGQTFMLRTINTNNIRHRSPAPNQKDYRRQSLSLHPAPLPDCAKQSQPPNWKAIAPAPEIKLSKVENGIVISWKLETYNEDVHESIASYQIYAYQETASPPSTSLWKKIGDVKALPLPMACTLTQFVSGYKYYFAVRAVDIRSRLGPFSSPSNIMLVNK